VRIHVLERSQLLPRPPGEAFELFADACNLEAITPPLLHFRMVSPAPIEMRVGTLIRYRLRLHGFPIDWLTRIDEWEPGLRFVDSQLAGPYRLWHHTHEFEPHALGTLMRDTVHYALPLWPLGELALPLVRRDLRRIFDHRHAKVVRLLTR
jgi:ligand-binding SRPBCC domain-containing protein